MELTEENVLKVLAELGSTADEVAASLKAASIKGVRRECAICPIANYLKQKFPDYFVRVGLPILFSRKNGEITLRVARPLAIDHFIKDFDSGIFPDLIG